jgi:predicted phosphoribosyltransferase
MGAIATGGVVILNDDVVRGLNIRPEVVQRRRRARPISKSRSPRAARRR